MAREAVVCSVVPLSSPFSVLCSKIRSLRSSFFLFIEYLMKYLNKYISYFHYHFVLGSSWKSARRLAPLSRLRALHGLGALVRHTLLLLQGLISRAFYTHHGLFILMEMDSHRFLMYLFPLSDAFDDRCFRCPFLSFPLLLSNFECFNFKFLVFLLFYRIWPCLRSVFSSIASAGGNGEVAVSLGWVKKWSFAPFSFFFPLFYF